MTATEQLILNELAEIKARLNQLYVPLVSEQTRQLTAMSPEQQKAAAHERYRAKRAALRGAK